MKTMMTFINDSNDVWGTQVCYSIWKAV